MRVGTLRVMSSPPPAAPTGRAFPRAGGGVWLEVAFAEKDHAKSLGARWDPQAKMWFAPPGSEQGLSPWWALPPEFPWEDRTFGSGLFVDLIPTSCWFTNVRSCVSTRDWVRIRKMVYGRAGNRCEACGSAENKAAGLRMEAHERWLYDEDAHIQYLRRLVCLCARCHQSTHFGYAEVTGNGARAFAHLSAVTGYTNDQTAKHIADAVVVWRERSRYDWTLNLRMLTDAGIAVAPPAPAPDRRAAAARETQAVRPPPRRHGGGEPGMSIEPIH